MSFPRAFVTLMVTITVVTRTMQGVRFERVFVQVRSTLSHIAERGASDLPEYVETHADAPFPSDTQPSARLMRALIHYVTWHEHLLTIADHVYRVEDADMNAVCRLTQQSSGCVADDDGEGAVAATTSWRQLVSVDVEREDSPETSWAELEALSPAFATRAKAIASTLGYCTSDAPGAKCVHYPAHSRYCSANLGSCRQCG